jgi:type II secretory pathway pseudopilin PulG
MTRAMLRRRLRALSRDERGFTLLETVIAITVMFASLVALAYTATIGFKSIAYARERVTFDGVADRIMEEIRGQAYTKIQTGLLTSDVTGDSNIINCGGTPIVYRFESCSTGEQIVTSGGVTATPWIYPHSGTVAAAAISNNVAYTWSTYITNNDATTQPYRVTVIVQWASAAYPNKTNNLVRVQSLFASPAGCVSSSTHPFAAPCQPFFYGLAQVPAGKITVTGTVQGLTFNAGYLQTTGTESNLQNEQVTQGRATFAESLASITDALGTRTEGGIVSGAQAADSDPNAPGATYGTTSEVAGTGGTVSSSSGSTSITFTAPPGDTGRADVAVAAGGASVCPPPTDLAETDGLPCVGGRMQQGGTLSSILALGSIVPGLGSATLASVAAAASSPAKSFADREAVSGQDGRIEVSATRNFGVIGLGAFPSGITAPAGFTYLLRMPTGYQDTVTSQAGTTTTAAPSTGTPTGNVSVWNGAGYTSFGPTASGLNNLTSTATSAATIAGRAVVVTISVDAGSTAAQAGTHQTNPSGSLRTDADSSVAAFSATVHYVVTVDGVTAVDLEIALQLGTILTRGVYGTPPASG